MFLYFLPFIKVSGKNIYYCGQEVGETHMAHIVSN